MLGKINDLAVLRHAIDEHTDAIYMGDANTLRRAVLAHRAELRHAAIPIARRIYDAPSDVFAELQRLGASDNELSERLKLNGHSPVRDLARRSRKLVRR